MYALLGVIVKPVLVIKIADYKWKDILSTFTPCIRVTIAALPIPLLVYYNMRCNFVIISFIAITLVSIIAVLFSVWFVGIDKYTKRCVIGYIKKFFETFQKNDSF